MKAREVQPESISSVLQTSVAHPKAKAQPTQMKTPEGAGPLLKWQVANEYDIYGYEIYRSDSENGNFHRISDKIIERLEGDQEVGSSYQWRDNTAATGKTCGTTSTSYSIKEEAKFSPRRSLRSDAAETDGRDCVRNAWKCDPWVVH
jgi:hypothetical protein